MSLKNEERKNQVLDYVRGYIRENGVSPTTSEIAAAMKMAKSTVSKYVTRLIDEGMVERNGRYRLQTSENSFVPYMMPVIGRVSCGKPRLAEEDIRGYIPLDESMARGEYFGLVAEGDSMIEVGIHDGDIVYVRRQETCDDGDIVVAMIDDEYTDGTEATLKRFYRDCENKRYILHPENSEMEDIIVDNVRILGVALKVLKFLR